MNKKIKNFIIVSLVLSLFTLVSSAQTEIKVYEFTDVTTDPFVIMGPGFDSFPLAQYSFTNIPTDNGFPNATDGKGLKIKTEPGNGLLLLAPVHSFNGPAMIRCSIRSTHKDIVPVIGTIDMATNNFVSTQTANDGSIFVNQYRRLTTFHTPPTGVFQPVIQISNISQTQLIDVYIDNLQVYHLASGEYYSTEFIDGDEADPAVISMPSLNCSTPTPVPTPSGNAPALDQLLGQWNLDIAFQDGSPSEDISIEFQSNNTAALKFSSSPNDSLPGTYTYNEETGAVSATWDITSVFVSFLFQINGVLLDAQSMQGTGTTSGGLVGGTSQQADFNYTALKEGALPPTPTPTITPNFNAPQLAQILGTWNCSLVEQVNSELQNFTVILKESGETELYLSPDTAGDFISGSYTYNQATGNIEASWGGGSLYIVITIQINGQLNNSQSMQGTLIFEQGTTIGGGQTQTTVFNYTGQKSILVFTPKPVLTPIFISTPTPTPKIIIKEPTPIIFRP